MSRKISEDCASDLLFDQTLAGELSPDEQNQVEAHLEQCHACRNRFTELQRDHRSFRSAVPQFEYFSNARAVSQYSRGKVAVTLSALTAAAAVFAIYASRPVAETPWSVPSAVTRTKGSSGSLNWVVRRAGHVLTGRMGQALHPSDQLRFSVRVNQPSYAAVIGVSSQGLPSVYAPSSGEMAFVQPGEEALLSGAIELDNSAGRERVVAVFCEQSKPTEELLKAFQGAPLQPALPSDCFTKTETLYKETP